MRTNLFEFFNKDKSILSHQTRSYSSHIIRPLNKAELFTKDIFQVTCFVLERLPYQTFSSLLTQRLFNNPHFDSAFKKLITPDLCWQTVPYSLSNQLELVEPLQSYQDYAQFVKHLELIRPTVLNQQSYPPFKFYYCQEFEKGKSIAMLLYNHSLADGTDFYKLLYLITDQDKDEVKLNMDIMQKYQNRLFTQVPDINNEELKGLLEKHSYRYSEKQVDVYRDSNIVFKSIKVTNEISKLLEKHKLSIFNLVAAIQIRILSQLMPGQPIRLQSNNRLKDIRLDNYEFGNSFAEFITTQNPSSNTSLIDLALEHKSKVKAQLIDQVPQLLRKAIIEEQNQEIQKYLYCDGACIQVGFLNKVKFGGAQILQTFSHEGLFSQTLDQIATYINGNLNFTFVYEKEKDLTSLIDKAIEETKKLS